MKAFNRGIGMTSQRTRDRLVERLRSEGMAKTEALIEDFIAAGGETEAKRAGHQRLEMKQYIVQDYDLMNIRANK